MLYPKQMNNSSNNTISNKTIMEIFCNNKIKIFKI